MFRTGLFNFSKGELGPALWGRVDVAAYNAALRQARNVVILKYGGVTRRMGSRVAYEIEEPEAGWDDPESQQRLVPFEFSIEQSYALLFTHAAMRPLALGGAVLEEELAITNISLATEAVITSPYHDYDVGDEWFASGIAGELGALLNGRIWKVTEIVNDQSFKINADTTGLDAFTTATGGTLRTEAPDPPAPAPVVPTPTAPPEPPVVFDPGGYYWPRDGWEFY